MDDIRISTVKCSVCPHTFEVVEDGKTETRCPRCKAKHINIDGVWYDAKMVADRDMN